jgi:hypothetical protein
MRRKSVSNRQLYTVPYRTENTEGEANCEYAARNTRPAARPSTTARCAYCVRSISYHACELFGSVALYHTARAGQYCTSARSSISQPSNSASRATHKTTAVTPQASRQDTGSRNPPQPPGDRTPARVAQQSETPRVTQRSARTAHGSARATEFRVCHGSRGQPHRRWHTAHPRHRRK